MPGSLYTSSSKNRLVLIIKTSVFALILGIFCIFISRAYSEASDKNLINAWNKQRFQDFYATEKNTLDMVFIGSSHSYCTFDPLLIDELLDVNSFQMGMPLQMADSSYYTLLEILNYQSPDIVVMELYWKLLDKSFDLKQAETLFQVMDNDALKADYINKGFPIAEKVKYLLPFIRFQQDFFAYKNKELLDFFSEEYGLTKTEERQEGEEYYSDKGFMHCDYNIPAAKYGSANQYANFDGKAWSIHKNQQHYLDKIIELCEQKKIRLVFVTAPVANVSMEKIKNYSYVHEIIRAYAQKNHIPYLDFNIVNMNLQLFTNGSFRDDAHLNYSGAVIACEYFAGFMTGNGM